MVLLMTNQIYNFCQQQVEILNTQKHQRELIIGAGRKVLMAGKSAIFAIHDNDQKLAEQKIAEALTIAKEIEKKIKKVEILVADGSWQASIEELAEAYLFNLTVNNKPLKNLPLKSIQAYAYLGAMADVSGELVRYAVLRATEGNVKTVEACCDQAKEIIKGLTSAYLSGPLRQKCDDAKRNIKRLEQIRYELSLNSYRAKANTSDQPSAGKVSKIK